MIYPNSTCVSDYKEYGVMKYLFSDEKNDFYYYAEPNYNNNHQWIIRIFGERSEEFCINLCNYSKPEYKWAYAKAITLAQKYTNLI